jgi:hypothetical protein
MFISEGGDVGMSECRDAMADCFRRLSMPMSVRGVLQGLPRMLVSTQVILFSLLLGGAMGMRRDVV